MPRNHNDRKSPDTISKLNNRAFVVCGLFAFHILVSSIMYLIAISPYLASYHNGHGLWNFAMDSFSYHDIAVRILGLNQDGSLSGFFQRPWFRHSEYISLMYYLLYPAPISFAPVNGVAWTLCVVLAYRTAIIITGDNRKLSAAAALTLGLWPSYLLLSTQLLRDIFFSLGILMTLLGWVAMLRGHTKYIYILLASLGIIFSVHIRHEPFWLLIFISLLACVIIALANRKTLPHAVMSMSVLLLFYGCPTMAAFAFDQTPGHNTGTVNVKTDDEKILAVKEYIKSRVGSAYSPEMDDRISKWFSDDWFSPWTGFEAKKERLYALAGEHGRNLDSFLGKWMTPWEFSGWLPLRMERAVVKANEYRSGFLVWYLKPGSSLVDSDVQFRSVYEVFAYIPRAVEIGFFAPFPNQWLSTGETGGNAIRIASGVEMIALYILMIGFALFLIKSPTPARIKIWLVLFMIVMIVPLAVFVPNLGTLFRMRFIYLAPIIIAGIEGFHILIRTGKRPQLTH